MGIYPPPIERLIVQLSRFPGVGPKSATRLALFIARNKGNFPEKLSEALIEVNRSIKFCPECYNFTDKTICDICSDLSRFSNIICVVEGPGDQLAIEESGSYRGRYHILHGNLSPLNGIGPKDLRIGELLSRIKNNNITEIIFATNPTAEGETTASYVAKLVVEANPKIALSRIALGVPVGGDLKFTDRMTLNHAIKCRIPLISECP